MYVRATSKTGAVAFAGILILCLGMVLPAFAEENSYRILFDLAEDRETAPDRITLPAAWTDAILEAGRRSSESKNEEGGCLYAGKKPIFVETQSTADKIYQLTMEIVGRVQGIGRNDYHGSGKRFYGDLEKLLKDYDLDRRNTLGSETEHHGVVTEGNEKSEFTVSLDCAVRFGLAGTFHTHPIDNVGNGFSDGDMELAYLDFSKGHTFSVVVGLPPTNDMMLVTRTQKWSPTDKLPAVKSYMSEVLGLNINIKSAYLLTYYRQGEDHPEWARVGDEVGKWQSLTFQYILNEIVSEDLVFYRGTNGEFHKIPFAEVDTITSTIWKTGKSPPDIKVAANWVGTLMQLFQDRWDMASRTERFLERVRASAAEGVMGMDSHDTLIAAMIRRPHEPDLRKIGTSGTVTCLEMTAIGIANTRIIDDKDVALMLSPACSIASTGRLKPAFVPGALMVSFKDGHPYSLMFYMGDGCLEEYAIRNDYEIASASPQCPVKPWPKTQ